MGNYARKVKRQSQEKRKAPRCCGQRMFMNKAGLWQCRKCGKQKFDIGPAPAAESKPGIKEDDVEVIEPEEVEIIEEK